MTGASVIERALRRATDDGRLGFIPYVTAGDPDLDGTRRLAAALAAGGADVLELGVPWSDPLADGPVNQRSAERALASGTNLRRVLGAVPGIKEDARVPVVLFSYFNPILRYGLETFAEAAAGAGVDGVVVTDLPPEEAGEYRAALDRQGIATVFLVTPTSTDDRIAAAARASRGFVYAVSRTGVTGARTSLEESLALLLRRVRNHTPLPVAVGFGISAPEQVSALRGLADAFVVGSALVDCVGRLGAGDEGLAEVRSLARKLAAAAR